MEIKKIIESVSLKALIWIMLAIVIVLAVFNLGVIVGFKEASFTYKWNDNYHRNFAGPQAGFGQQFQQGMVKGEFMPGDGIFGVILKIDTQTISVKDRDGMEKVIKISKDTSIKKFKEDIKFGDLKINDSIVVIGQPNNDGQVDARLIRVLPNPELGNNNQPSPVTPSNSNTSTSPIK